ncbi:MAG: beta-propeller protein methanol dehydrogenase [Anaerocolumna sp.]|jgi:uncharacterized protein|nr:beta-propeller protein methanol dehydrogenase [Anaerocolumna sp.]
MIRIKNTFISTIKTGLIALIICVMLLPLFQTVAFAAPGDQMIYDPYGLFTDDEITKLESLSSEYGEEGKVDLVIITTDDLNGNSVKTYLENYYDNNGFGYDKEFGDAVLLLINMEPGKRSVTIQGYGQAEYYVNNDRIEYMLDDITPLLSDGRYFDAMEEYLKQAAYYMNEEQGVKISPATGAQGSGYGYGESSYNGPSNYYGTQDDPIYYNSLFQLAVALIIGAVSVGVMAYNAGGRVTTNNRTYLDQKNSRIVASRDDYIRTTTTRVKKPSSNNNGGGRSSGGGGISSGGHSHSGGSRGF